MVSSNGNPNSQPSNVRYCGGCELWAWPSKQTQIYPIQQLNNSINPAPVRSITQCDKQGKNGSCNSREEKEGHRNSTTHRYVCVSRGGPEGGDEKLKLHTGRGSVASRFVANCKQQQGDPWPCNLFMHQDSTRLDFPVQFELG